MAAYKNTFIMKDLLPENVDFFVEQVEQFGPGILYRTQENVSRQINTSAPNNRYKYERMDVVLDDIAVAYIAKRLKCDLIRADHLYNFIVSDFIYDANEKSDYSLIEKELISVLDKLTK